MRKLIYIFILLLPFHNFHFQLCFAQQYDFTVYSTQHGLPQSYVTALYQDSKGYLWIGTQNGLSRFDGSKFLVFGKEDGLINARVHDINEDEKGNILISTSGGLCVFNGVNFKAYTKKNGLQKNLVLNMRKHSTDSIWLVTSGGISIYRDGEILNFRDDLFKGKETRCMAEKNDGTKYFSTDGIILKVSPNGGLDSIARRGEVLDMIIDSKENLWTGSWGYPPLIKVDKNEKIIPFPEIRSHVTSIIQDKRGRIWVGTWDAGLFLIDGESIRNFTTKNGLPINSIWKLMEDTEGNIWMGSFGGGLVRFRSERFIQLSEKDGLVNNSVIATLIDDQGILWAGTDVGISRIEINGDNFKFTDINQHNGVKIGKVVDIAEDHFGEIWFALYSSELRVFRYKNGAGAFEKKITETACFGILADKDGDLWFGTDRFGAFKYDYNTSVKYLSRGANRVTDIFQDSNDNIWLGTDLRGVNLMIGDSMVNMNMDKQIQGVSVNCIVEDTKGHLWISTTDAGLYRCKYTPDSGLWVVDWINKARGLANDNIESMIFDEKGNLWLGTSSGINCIEMDTYYADGALKIKYYGISEGMKNIECRWGSSVDSTGKLWFTTGEGLIRYNPDEDFYNDNESIINFTGITLFLKQPDWAGLGIAYDSITNLPIDLVLPYDQNHLTFSYIGLCYTAPEKVRYKWKLEGYDNEWSPVSEKSEVTYSNLDPGLYSLMVVSLNNEGVWNKKPANFSFEIEKPYWEEGWFYFAQLAFFIVLIGGTLLLRHRGTGGTIITVLVFICLFIIFEYIQNLFEPMYESYVGSAPIIKTFLNLLLAVMLLPAQMLLRKILKGKKSGDKKPMDSLDEMV